MNTLTGIEAERVDQILQHALLRLELLSFVPAADDEALLAQLSCVPVSAALDRLWLAESQLAEIFDASALGGRDVFTVKAAHRAVKACCRCALGAIGAMLGAIGAMHVYVCERGVGTSSRTRRATRSCASAARAPAPSTRSSSSTCTSTARTSRRGSRPRSRTRRATACGCRT